MMALGIYMLTENELYVKLCMRTTFSADSFGFFCVDYLYEAKG